MRRATEQRTLLPEYCTALDPGVTKSWTILRSCSSGMVSRASLSVGAELDAAACGVRGVPDALGAEAVVGAGVAGDGEGGGGEGGGGEGAGGDGAGGRAAAGGVAL